MMRKLAALLAVLLASLRLTARADGTPEPPRCPGT